MEGSGRLRTAIALPRIDLERLSRTLPFVFGAVVLAILVAKLLLVWRINVNWDEFLYLSKVHALTRGELDLLLQGAYTHLFQWVVMAGTNEVDQIVVSRLPMWSLLVLAAWLLYRLARIWASPNAAAFAVLAFIGSWPVLKHGASFRADSMLLPLTIGTLLLAVRPRGRRAWNDAMAGLCLGAAFALTTKAALLLPVLLAMVLIPDDRLTRVPLAHATRRLAAMLAIAALFGGLLIGIHSMQVVAGAESAGNFASRALMATLVDVPLLPRGDIFRGLIFDDAVFWLAVPAGLLVALTLRRYQAAAAVLALMPILFYRNAFPYYYPLMMAPAAILVALAADRMLGTSSTPRPRGFGLTMLAVLGLLLMKNSWNGLMAMRFDGQQQQRSLVAAVHQVFPDPVSYLDHSGMIASFPKANFFMSTWGVEHYLRIGRDFMPEALEKHRPPLLLVNHGALLPGALLFRRLRETDRKLLASSYVEYWGPIRVAGVDVKIPAGQAVNARLPFPGRYRIESGTEIFVDGERYRPGDILVVNDSLDRVLRTVPDSLIAATIRLVWAEAREPPSQPPPLLPLYSPL